MNRSELFLRLFLGTVSSFNLGTDGGQHGLSLFGMRAGRREVWILLEGFGGARRRDHFIALQGRLADEVRTLPVVGVGFIGVGCDGLVEGIYGGLAHYRIVLEIGVS